MFLYVAVCVHQRRHVQDLPKMPSGCRMSLHIKYVCVYTYTGFPGSSAGKESACSAGDSDSIPGLGSSPGEGIGYPLQYAWAPWWLRWLRIHLQCGKPGFYPWVGIEEPGRLQSMRLQRVGHDWVTKYTAQHIHIHVYIVVVKSLSHVGLFHDPMGSSLPGPSVHGISQARILEWVAISISKGSSWPRDWTCISCIAGRFFSSEPPGKLLIYIYVCMYVYTYIHIHICIYVCMCVCVYTHTYKHIIGICTYTHIFLTPNFITSWYLLNFN